MTLLSLSGPDNKDYDELLAAIQHKWPKGSASQTTRHYYTLAKAVADAAFGRTKAAHGSQDDGCCWLDFGHAVEHSLLVEKPGGFLWQTIQI
jgi:hypothetical protein